MSAHSLPDDGPRGLSATQAARRLAADAVRGEFGAETEQRAAVLLHASDAVADRNPRVGLALQIARAREMVGVRVRLEDPSGYLELACCSLVT